MASEIRANKQTNRVGLGTVTYTDTGIIVSGIVTANSISGGSSVTATTFYGSGSALTGIDATALKDPAGNVKIQAQASGAVHSGISTFSSLVKLPDSTNNQTGRLMLGTGSDLQIFHTGSAGEIGNFTGNLNIKTNSFRVFNGGATQLYIKADQNDSVILHHSNNEKFRTTNAGAVVTGILTATSFSGDGSSLSNLPAGAPVGGATTNTVFFENDTAVAVNYQITSGKNAMSAGPIAINAGIAVTVPSGSSWTIV